MNKFFTKCVLSILTSTFSISALASSLHNDRENEKTFIEVSGGRDVAGVEYKFLSTPGSCSDPLVDLWTVNNDYNQSWRIELIPKNERMYVDNSAKMYRIRNNKCVNDSTQKYLSMSSERGSAQVDLYFEDDRSGRQQWYVTYDPKFDGFVFENVWRKRKGMSYALSTQKSGQLVDAYARNDGSGRQVWQVNNQTKVALLQQISDQVYGTVTGNWQPISVCTGCSSTSYKITTGTSGTTTTTSSSSWKVGLALTLENTVSASAKKGIFEGKSETKIAATSSFERSAANSIAQSFTKEESVAIEHTCEKGGLWQWVTRLERSGGDPIESRSSLLSCSVESPKSLLMSNIIVEWDATYGREYSLDVKPIGSDWIAPCVGADVIGMDGSVNFAGRCLSGSSSGRAVALRNVEKLRVCSAIDGRWGEAICRAIQYDGSSPGPINVDFR